MDSALSAAATTHSEPFLLTRRRSQSGAGEALSAFDVSRSGSPLLARSLICVGLLSSALSSAQPGPMLPALSCTQLGPSLPLQGRAWLGHSPLALDLVNLGLFLFVQSGASFGTAAMTKLELSSCLSVRSMTNLEFLSSVLSCARFESTLLVLDFALLGSPVPLHSPA